jgi:hypothetical protein
MEGEGEVEAVGDVVRFSSELPQVALEGDWYIDPDLAGEEQGKECRQDDRPGANETQDSSGEL